MVKNPIGWFELPVSEMGRAKDFYETVLDISITVHDLDGLIMGWFPGNHTNPGSSGSLVQHEMYTPSAEQGVLIYFSCEDLSNELGRVAAAGGTVLRPKTAIGEGHGFMALMLDTEGNRVALHSPI
ncbi:VOC family protein [Muriicola sp. Z0-33]|uniref:VOC family protein n=1 Tax=Muriicola sp. Z0-33 TaxID=2816957 RepID=UPI0022375ACB|nr:VOC family protein [Muriicola sp. Z0-33]MCW5517095.1 VOC family protein [Muriicola sp. Z0-33]